MVLVGVQTLHGTLRRLNVRLPFGTRHRIELAPFEGHYWPKTEVEILLNNKGNEALTHPRDERAVAGLTKVPKGLGKAIP
jgi:hypothetical protein